MESEKPIRGDTAERIKDLWKVVEENRDQAVASAAHAAHAAIECGQILAELRKDFGNAGWSKWMSVNVPEIPLPKATRLANIGPKYGNIDDLQLEFRTVKELYQATDILPPAPAAQHKSKVVDLNWPKLVTRLEAMVPHLNDGQKALLKRALVKLTEGL